MMQSKSHIIDQHRSQTQSDKEKTNRTELYELQLVKAGLPFGDAREIAQRTDLCHHQKTVKAIGHRENQGITPDSNARYKLSSRDKSTLGAIYEIRQTAPKSENLTFSHSILCHLGLPRRNPRVREFHRSFGRAWLNVQAGYIDIGSGPEQQNLPYGAFPRIALAAINTLAVRNKKPDIFIGHSAAEFLRDLGMDSQGARYKTMREQMHALAACRMQMGFDGKTFNEHTIKQFDVWSRNESESNQVNWSGRMVLSDEYHKEILEHAVPLDQRALSVIKGSALSLDIYFWLAHRLYTIKRSPIFLSWRNLKDQFGHEYLGQYAEKNFKKSFSAALRSALDVYPKANVRVIPGGIEICQSPPPIPKKRSGRIWLE